MSLSYFVVFFKIYDIMRTREGEHMENNINLNIIEDYLMSKITENERILRCTFYEIRVRLNISENDEAEFLKFARIRLENLGYRVYFTGAKFTYENVNRTVQSNELIIAIKEY